MHGARQGKARPDLRNRCPEPPEVSSEDNTAQILDHHEVVSILRNIC
jgi:hypothetical protein